MGGIGLLTSLVGCSKPTQKIKSFLTFTNGKTQNIETIEDFNKLGSNDDENTVITLSNGSFVKNTVLGFDFGDNPFEITQTPAFFLYNYTSLNTGLILPNNILTIGFGFLSGCASFNADVTLPSSLKFIDDNFLSSCSSYNREIMIPKSVISIGDNFMGNCASFNGTVYFGHGGDSELESIGERFLNDCPSYNQMFSLPNSITEIGTFFMWNCYAFVSPLDIKNLNATIFQASANSFAVSDSAAAVYTTGFSIGGTYKNEIKAKFADNASEPYRKII
ncbi:MAG: leucine-rich repeat domain-containing protein [Mycoplasmataceae bacterium]|nr:leucine-rich repeat domain-containing protein [Mycoplasmataceae bacterium]